MKRLLFVFLPILLAGPAADAMEYAGSVGHGAAVILPGTDSNPCPPAELCLNFDGSAENGYCWQYGGIGEPYWGAFAECCGFDGSAEVCGLRFLFTGVGYPCRPLDGYVWDDAGGRPGNVLSMTAGLDPCPVATWPSVSTHDFAISPTCVDGFTWIGYWADYDLAPCGYFVAADTNGFGGCPFTNIVIGIGYPTGWNDVSVVWGPTQAIGIGAWYVQPCGGNPVRNTTWGRVKSFY